jgi:hypothetical protein
MGQFLGFSEKHSSLVGLVRDLSMGFVSPQYHLVFDNLFDTDFSANKDDVVIDSICKGLFNNNQDIYVEPEYDDAGELVYKC